MPKRNDIASPTIAEVLAEFLADQEKRLAPRTCAKYRDVLELFQDSLDGYAYQGLGERDTKLFERYFNASGSQHREFCQIFGPEHIPRNVGEFLGYFMVRKVIAGKDLMRAAGTVMRKLAKWLAEKGYVEAEEARDAAERGGAAARDLPRSRELLEALFEFSDRQPRGKPEDEIEGHFVITRLEPRKMWLEDLGGDEVGPIALPEEIRRQCEVGWTIAGTVGRARGKWRLVDAWNVYPG